MTKTPAECMRAARDKAGKTQADIAHELGVTQPLIAKWEAGDALPRTEDVRKVAKAYGLKPEQILPQEDKSEKAS